MQSSNSARQPGRPGRPYKGDRHATMVKMPVELHREVQALAEAEGLHLGDYLTRIIAEAHGRTAPAYCYPQPTAQEELPIARAS
jgi:hypothetical protein